MKQRLTDGGSYWEVDTDLDISIEAGGDHEVYLDKNDLLKMLLAIEKAEKVNE